MAKGESNMALSKEAQEMKKMMRENNMRSIFNDREPFDNFVKQMGELQSKPYVMPDSVYEQANVEVFETSGGAKVYTFTPLEGVENDINVIYYHGGGFVAEIGEISWPGYIRIANKLRCAVTVPSYRQVPTNGWHETYADSVDTYRHVLETHAPEKVAFIGESAGGHLVLAVAVLAKMEGLPQPGLLIPMSPWSDFANILPGKREMAETDLLLGWISMTELPQMWAPDLWDKEEFPVNLFYADFEGLAPTIVTAGGEEMLLPDADLIVDKLKKAGVEVEYHVVEGMWHAFVGMPNIPECENMMAYLLDKISKL